LASDLDIFAIDRARLCLLIQEKRSIENTEAENCLQKEKRAARHSKWEFLKHANNQSLRLIAIAVTDQLKTGPWEPSDLPLP
jgi:hypothetical protein